MRLFALLFAVYLCCLACMPCADDVQGCGAQVLTSISPTPHSDRGQHDLGDWCSPLCQCHCCAGAVLAASKAVQLAYPAPAWWAIGRYHALLLVAAPTRATATVWQPPRGPDRSPFSPADPAK